MAKAAMRGGKRKSEGCDGPQGRSSWSRRGFFRARELARVAGLPYMCRWELSLVRGV